MRRFFQVGRGAGEETAVGVAAVDPLSCVSASQIGAGTITKSVVCHTISDLVECEGSIVVGVTAQTIKLGKGCIVYVHPPPPPLPPLPSTCLPRPAILPE
jgi:hypothetical protein